MEWIISELISKLRFTFHLHRPCSYFFLRHLKAGNYHLVAFYNADNENNQNSFCFEMALLCLVEAWKHTQVLKLDFKLSLFQHHKFFVLIPRSFPGKFGRDPGDTEHN